jgi:hypothetical protein
MTFTKGMRKPPNGGRRKGTPNKATAANQAEIAASGLTPLQFQTKKYMYYYGIVGEELAKDAPDRDRIDFALMAGGIAARDAAPYVHARVNPIEEQPPNPVTIVRWNLTPEMLEKYPSIRRGKPFDPFMIVQRDGPASSVIEEQERPSQP